MPRTLVPSLLAPQSLREIPNRSSTSSARDTAPTSLPGEGHAQESRKSPLKAYPGKIARSFVEGERSAAFKAPRQNQSNDTPPRPPFTVNGKITPAHPEYYNSKATAGAGSTAPIQAVAIRAPAAQARIPPATIPRKGQSLAQNLVRSASGNYMVPNSAPAVAPRVPTVANSPIDFIFGVSRRRTLVTNLNIPVHTRQTLLDINLPYHLQLKDKYNNLLTNHLRRMRMLRFKDVEKYLHTNPEETPFGSLADDKQHCFGVWRSLEESRGLQALLHVMWDAWEEIKEYRCKQSIPHCEAHDSQSDERIRKELSLFVKEVWLFGGRKPDPKEYVSWERKWSLKLNVARRPDDKDCTWVMGRWRTPEEVARAEKLFRQMWEESTQRLAQMKEAPHTTPQRITIDLTEDDTPTESEDTVVNTNKTADVDGTAMRMNEPGAQSEGNYGGVRIKQEIEEMEEWLKVRWEKMTEEEEKRKEMPPEDSKPVKLERDNDYGSWVKMKFMEVL